VQVAAQLTQGIANVAAAIQPQEKQLSSDMAMSYEEGAKHYNEYQLAIFKGFAHTHLLNEVPLIWPMFNTQSIWTCTRIITSTKCKNGLRHNAFTS
jgi:hypothetical protein